MFGQYEGVRVVGASPTFFDNGNTVPFEDRRATGITIGGAGEPPDHPGKPGAWTIRSPLAKAGAPQSVGAPPGVDDDALPTTSWDLTGAVTVGPDGTVAPALPRQPVRS